MGQVIYARTKAGGNAYNLHMVEGRGEAIYVMTISFGPKPNIDKEEHERIVQRVCKLFEGDDELVAAPEE